MKLWQAASRAWSVMLAGVRRSWPGGRIIPVLQYSRAGVKAGPCRQRWRKTGRAAANFRERFIYLSCLPGFVRGFWCSAADHRMNIDSPVVSRDVVAKYDEWHEQMGAGSGDPRRFPWYASVVEEFGSGLTGEVLEVGSGRGEFAHSLASVVRHSDRRVCRVRRARLTFSKISAARAVQMNGLGL